MGVIMGATGKSPSIEKYNRLLQADFNQSSGEYLEKQIVMEHEKMNKRYPKTEIDWSFIERGEDSDESV